jgi:phage terminase small subunit
MRKLTEKQRKWLAAYLADPRCNATEAAKAAGYKGNRVTLAQIGSKTRRVPQVAAAIEADLMRHREELIRQHPYMKNMRW